MPQVDTGNSAGFDVLQISTLTSTGIWTGQAGTAPSANTTSHALRTTNVTTAGFNPRTQTTAEFRGGNRVVGQIAFGDRSLQPFTIEMDATEGDLIALTSGSNVDVTTNALWATFGTNPYRVTLPQMGLMLTTRFQSREAATEGLDRYMNIVIPVATVTVTLGGANYQATNPVTLTVTPTAAAKFPNGVPFGTNQGWDSNKTDHYVHITDYPLSYTYYKANGVATTFITGYRPISTTVTVSNAPNWSAKNGTATALDSIVIATGVATLSAAGDSGDQWGLLYETQFTAI